MAGMLVVLLSIGVIAVSSILNGWALSILWGWFFVPVLDVPPLSIPQAIGISIVVGFLTKQIDTTKSEYKDSSKSVGAAFLYPLLALFIGWIVKGFM